MKYLLTTIVSLAGFQAGAQHHSTTQQKQQPANSANSGVVKPPQIFNVVEQMPHFNGDLVNFLQSNLHYPDSARKDSVEGRVVVKFVVWEDGSINDVIVVRSSGNELLDNEAVRVVRLMPRWIPGKQEGKPVRVYFTLPITFKLD